MKRYIVYVLIYCLMIQLSSCYTPQLVSKKELISIPHNEGLLVKTNEQMHYFFESGSYVIVNDSISGRGSLILENGAKVKQNNDRHISLEEVESIKLEKIDAVKTVIYIAVSIGLGVLLILGINSLMEDATKSIAEGIGRGLQRNF